MTFPIFARQKTAKISNNAIKRQQRRDICHICFIFRVFERQTDVFRTPVSKVMEANMTCISAIKVDILLLGFGLGLILGNKEIRELGVFSPSNIKR